VLFHHAAHARYQIRAFSRIRNIFRTLPQAAVAIYKYFTLFDHLNTVIVAPSDLKSNRRLDQADRIKVNRDFRTPLPRAGSREQRKHIGTLSRAQNHVPPVAPFEALDRGRRRPEDFHLRRVRSEGGGRGFGELLALGEGGALYEDAGK
jgi:hypothetical protein